MGRITTGVGLATGFPIADTVEKLMAVSARPRDQIAAQSKTANDQKTALTQLTVLVVGLQLTGTRLSAATLYNQRTATSSAESLISARVNSGASPAIGQYNFTPVQTAQSQQLLSSAFASKTTAVGAGSFSFGFGGFVDRSVSLDELRGGLGFERGKIRITDRSGASAEIDLTYARTVDDVLNAINNNGTIGVRAEANGDQFRLIDETGETTANLRVQEVGNRQTAASLGLSGINVAASSADGTDVLSLFADLSLARLNDGMGLRFDDVLPDLKVTFRDGTDATLDLRKLAVTGAKAAATTSSVNGSTANVKFSAVKGGSAYDDVVIRFVDNPNIPKGGETVAYDDSNPALKTLTFQIREGQTTARDVMNALNNDAAAKTIFTASLPPGSNGQGLVSSQDTVVTSGGGVTEPVPGGNETSLGDVLDALNALDPARLKAEISADGRRIELTDLSTDNGGTFKVEDINGSKVAADLGLTATAVGDAIAGRRLIGGLKTSLLSSLNGGAGFGALGLLDLTDRSGATASVDLSTAETLDDLLAVINGAGLGIQATINAARNGILLTDNTGQTASNLIIANGDGTNTADKLGLTLDAAQTSQSSGSLHLRTVGENTLLSSLYGGAGIPSGTFTITDTNGAKATVNVNENVKTIDDLIDAIKGNGLAIDIRVNDEGDGIVLIDTAEGTGTLSVVDVSGTAAKSLRLTNSVETIDINGQPTKVINARTNIEIAIGANDTLEDVAKKINDIGLGVRASIISDGSSVKPYRLSIYNERSGEANSLLFDTSAASFSLEETLKARDAILAVGDVAGGSGYLAASATNTFREAVPDVTLTVNGTSTSAVTISIGSSTESLTTAVKAFVDSYNKLVDKISEVTAFNVDTGASAILQGDGTVLRLQADISQLFSGRVFGAGSIQSLETLGVTLGQNGQLTFESSKLTAKFAEAPQEVSQFFTKTTYGLSARVKTLGDQLAGVGNSLLIGRTLALDDKITTYQQRIDYYNERLDRERERLLAKFYASEAAISKLQSNSSFLQTLQAVATQMQNFQ